MQVRTKKTHKKIKRSSTYKVEETNRTEWKSLLGGSSYSSLIFKQMSKEEELLERS